MNKIVFVFILLIAALVGIFALRTSSSKNDYIKIPVQEITGQAKFYEIEDRGVKIRFFAVRASDGSIKTAFDACDVCFRSKKGYRQEGNYIVCNNCGNRYLIDEFGTKNKRPGGCWPGYLENIIEGDYLIIKKSDLLEGRWRFE